MGQLENKEWSESIDIASDKARVTEAVAGMSDADQAAVWGIVADNLGLSWGSFRDPSGWASA